MTIFWRMDHGGEGVRDGKATDLCPLRHLESRSPTCGSNACVVISNVASRYD